MFSKWVVVAISKEWSAAIKLPRLNSPFHSTLGTFHYFRSLKFAECAKDRKEQFIVRCRTKLPCLEMDGDVFLLELLEDDELVISISTDAISVIDQEVSDIVMRF